MRRVLRRDAYSAGFGGERLRTVPYRTGRTCRVYSAESYNESNGVGVGRRRAEADGLWRRKWQQEGNGASQILPGTPCTKDLSSLGARRRPCAQCDQYHASGALARTRRFSDPALVVQ